MLLWLVLFAVIILCDGGVSLFALQAIMKLGFEHICEPHLYVIACSVSGSCPGELHRV